MMVAASATGVLSVDTFSGREVLELVVVSAAGFVPFSAGPLPEVLVQLINSSAAAKDNIWFFIK